MVVASPASALSRRIASALHAKLVDPSAIDMCAVADQLVVISAIEAPPSLDDATLEQVRAIVSADIDVPWHAYRTMLAQPGRFGRAIVHVQQVAPDALRFTAAADLLVRSAAKDAGALDQPVRVNGVTVMGDVPLDQLAATIAFLLSDDGRFVSGATVRLGSVR